VNGLLDVAGFDAWKVPHVAWVLSEGVSRIRPTFGALVRTLAGVLLWHTNRIKMEHVIISLREPENHFVPPGKTPYAVKPMRVLPHDAVS
jgi:hypothetical protein